MEQADNSNVIDEARNARRLDPWPNRLEAAQLIKPPASRGVSDFAIQRYADRKTLRSNNGHYFTFKGDRG
jgi:hypothetical protein